MQIIILLFVILLSGCVSMSKDLSEQQMAAEDNMQLGLAYLQQNDMPRAKEKLLLALQEAPDSPRVQDAMAYFLERTGDTVNAEIYYRRALKFAPNDGATLNNYGTFLCKEGKVNEAIQLFLKAVADPNYVNSARAYENAGLCALTLPDPSQARLYFTKALQEDSNCQLSTIELDKLNARS